MLKKTFEINKALYPTDAIKEVIAVFHDFQIQFDDGNGLLTFISEDDPQNLFDEFMNYLLVYLNE